MFLVFYRGNLGTLLNNVYFRYSGVDIEKYKQKFLNIKNNFISYKYLLAKLWGEQLISVYEKMQDYDKTTDEEFEILEKQLIADLRNANEWYLDRNDNLKYLCRCYNIQF